MIADLVGWFPAVILPTAAGLQLYRILRYKKFQGVSPLSWILFAVANLGAYVFAEKYFAVQSIMAFLLTAVLNTGVAVLVLTYREKPPKKKKKIKKNIK